MDIEEALAVAGEPAWLIGGPPRALHEIDNAAQRLQPALDLERPTAADGLVGPVRLRPIEALLRLTKATVPRVPDDVHDVYRHWSWLRHLGALTHGPGRVLGLSETGARVRAGHRRVMSDDLGVGFGLLLAEHWCRATGWSVGVTAVGLDVVLREGYGWLAPGRLADGRQPDYLLLLDDPALPTRKRVKTMVCKGTVAVGNAPGQLARAFAQLAGLRIDGSAPHGLAVATVSGPGDLCYQALGPDGGPRLELEVNGDRLDDVRRPKRLGHGGVLDLAGAELVPTAVAVAIGTLADYAGNAPAAARWLPPATLLRLGRTVRDRVIRESDDGMFIGVESSFPTLEGRRRLVVFRGLAAEVDEAISCGSVEEVAARQSELAVARRRCGRDALAARPASDTERSVSATSSDGALLRIAIE